MGGEMPSKSGESVDRNHQNILTDERLGWLKDLIGEKGPLERSKLREGLNSKVEIKSASFGLGDSTVDNKLNDEINNSNAEVLVGSVDATAYEMKWHENDWYKPFAQDAVKISKLSPLFDESTMEWYKSLAPAFKVFENLSSMNEADFSKNVKKNIWSLVKEKGGSKMIYGPGGFFNFVLAYKRIESLYSPIGLADLENFKLEDVTVKKIKLVAGKGVGEKGGASDRFAYAGIRKNEKIKEKVSNYSIGSEEFFKKYKIEVGEREDFMSGINLFEKFLKKPNRGLDFLSRSDWMEKRDDEDELRFSRRMDVLFAENGEIYNLRAIFEQHKDLYAEFYNDASNPDTIKYVNLYRLATLKILEYEDKTFEVAPKVRANQFSVYHEGMVSALDPVRVNPDFKKVALGQLIESSKYLSKNSLYAEEWPKKLKVYEGEFNEVAQK